MHSITRLMLLHVSPAVQVVLQNGAHSTSPEGEASKASVDTATSEAETNEALASAEDVVVPSANGHAASVPGDTFAEKAEVDLPSIQSPASALADNLSALSLATPAVKGYKASRLQAVTNELDSVPETEAHEPASAKEGDLAVGLVYDKIMEEHVGPPSASYLRSTLPNQTMAHYKCLGTFQALIQGVNVAGHVERPQRTAALVQKLKAAGLAARCWTLPPRQVIAP